MDECFFKNEKPAEFTKCGSPLSSEPLRSLFRTFLITQSRVTPVTPSGHWFFFFTITLISTYFLVSCCLSQIQFHERKSCLSFPSSVSPVLEECWYVSIQQTLVEWISELLSLIQIPCKFALKDALWAWLESLPLYEFTETTCQANLMSFS